MKMAQQWNITIRKSAMSCKRKQEMRSILHLVAYKVQMVEGLLVELAGKREKFTVPVMCFTKSLSKQVENSYSNHVRLKMIVSCGFMQDPFIFTKA
jgi:hypothetical protein